MRFAPFELTLTNKTSKTKEVKLETKLVRYEYFTPEVAKAIPSSKISFKRLYHKRRPNRTRPSKLKAKGLRSIHTPRVVRF